MDSDLNWEMEGNGINLYDDELGYWEREMVRMKYNLLSFLRSFVLYLGDRLYSGESLLCRGRGRG